MVGDILNELIDKSSRDGEADGTSSAQPVPSEDRHAQSIRLMSVKKCQAEAQVGTDLSDSDAGIPQGDMEKIDDEDTAIQIRV